MIPAPALPVIALATSILAAAVWGFVFVRSLLALGHGTEHRASYVLMAGTALLASLGTLASSIGFAVQRGVLPEIVSPDLMSFLASVGRGALLMGGIIIATHYRPPAAKE